MVASFFRNALLLVGINLLIKGTYLFAIDRTVQNRLPEGEYGLFFSLIGLSMLFQVVADFGLQLYNSRTISGHRQLLEKYFPHFLGLKLILGVLYFFLLIGAGLWLGYGGSARHLLFYAAGIQFLNSMVLYLRANLSGLGWFKLDSIISILDKSIVIFVIGGTLIFFPDSLDIWFFARTQGLAYLLTAMVLGVALSGSLPRKRPRLHWPTALLLLRGGAPFALAILLQTAYTRTDAVMIERLLIDGATQAGHYAAGYRLLDALNTIGWLLAGLLLPMYARLYVRKEKLQPLLTFSTQLLVGTGLVVAIPLAIYSEPVVYLLYDFATPETGYILFFLALSFVAQAANYAYGSLLSATGLIGRMNWFFAAAILLNVGGNFFLIPTYGATGAAAVTLLTQAVVALLQIALTHRWLPISFRAINWPGLIALGGILTGASLFAFTTFVGDGEGPNWIIQVVCLGLAGVLLMLLFRLLSVRQLLNFLRRR